MTGKVFIHEIFAEHLFDWFANVIDGEGGDGGSVIIANNFAEVAERFELWYDKRNGLKLSACHKKDVEDTMVMFYDSNENFTFADKSHLEDNMFEGEYIFVVMENCPSFTKQWVIEAIRGETT